jgi:hypothetical protein
VFAIQHDLLFQEPAPSSMLEAEGTSDEELGEPEGESEDFSWDVLVIESDDEEAIYDSD